MLLSMTSAFFPDFCSSHSNRPGVGSRVPVSLSSFLRVCLVPLRSTHRVQRFLQLLLRFSSHDLAQGGQSRLCIRHRHRPGRVRVQMRDADTRVAVSIDPFGCEGVVNAMEERMRRIGSDFERDVRWMQWCVCARMTWASKIRRMLGSADGSDPNLHRQWDRVERARSALHRVSHSCAT